MDLQSMDRVPTERFGRYVTYLLNKFPEANKDEIVEEAEQYIEDEVGDDFYMKLGWRDSLKKFLSDKYQSKTDG